jgi:hypothetical protein
VQVFLLVHLQMMTVVSVMVTAPVAQIVQAHLMVTQPLMIVACAMAATPLMIAMMIAVDHLVLVLGLILIQVEQLILALQQQFMVLPMMEVGLYLHVFGLIVQAPLIMVMAL